MTELAEPMNDVDETLVVQARAFVASYGEHTGAPAWELERRVDEVEAEIAERGTYTHTVDELEVGARLAWRNHTRCIGKLYWKSLTVRDCRGLTTVREVRDALVDHLLWAGNGGRIRPLLSVFAPDGPHDPGFRVRNRQLVSFAGYRSSGGVALGDQSSVDLTELARSLGWRCERPGNFDVLPLIIDSPAEGLSICELPPAAAPQVEIHHPTIPGLSALGLRWYGSPTVSDMAVSIGGIIYPLAPFTGWYVAPEISARDFTDPHRYGLLREIAQALGLDTETPHSLWQDRAIIELTAAVLSSYARAGIRIDDHHAASERFHRYTLAERRRGREVLADWSWIVPPLSPSATAVYHERYLSEERFPNFVRLTGPAAPPAAARCPFHAAATGTSAEPRPVHPARKALQP